MAFITPSEIKTAVADNQKKYTCYCDTIFNDNVEEFEKAFNKAAREYINRLDESNYFHFCFNISVNEHDHKKIDDNYNYIFNNVVERFRNILISNGYETVHGLIYSNFIKKRVCDGFNSFKIVCYHECCIEVHF